MENDNESVPKKQIQCRNWSFIVYPESMKESLFVDLLSDSDSSLGSSSEHSVLISPCHDKDVDEHGQLKKVHYHILIMWKNDVTLSAVKRYAEIRGLLLPERCKKKAMARYLCHLDNSDKHLYNADDVIAYNCNYLDIVGSSNDKFSDLRDLISFINENDILFFCDLVDYCKDNDDQKFQFLMSGGTYTLEKYIRERRAKYAYLGTMG